MLTEDTGTQGAGKFELELGFAQARDGGMRALEFGPQLSYGALDNPGPDRAPDVALPCAAAQPAARRRDSAIRGSTSSGGSRRRGSLTFGVRAGVDLPTGNADKSLGNGKASPHANPDLDVVDGHWMLAANVDYVYDPLIGDRRDLWGASAVAAYSPNDVWRFTAEVGTAMNPDLSQTSWLTVARFGAIATVVTGDRRRCRLSGAPDAHAPVEIILAGVTIRW